MWVSRLGEGENIHENEKLQQGKPLVKRVFDTIKTWFVGDSAPMAVSTKPAKCFMGKFLKGYFSPFIDNSTYIYLQSRGTAQNAYAGNTSNWSFWTYSGMVLLSFP